MKKLILTLLFLLTAVKLPAQTSATGRWVEGLIAKRPSSCVSGDTYVAQDTGIAYLCGPTSNVWVAFSTTASSGYPPAGNVGDIQDKINSTTFGASSINDSGIRLLFGEPSYFLSGAPHYSLKAFPGVYCNAGANDDTTGFNTALTTLVANLTASPNYGGGGELWVDGGTQYCDVQTLTIPASTNGPIIIHFEGSLHANQISIPNTSVQLEGGSGNFAGQAGSGSFAPAVSIQQHSGSTIPLIDYTGLGYLSIKNLSIYGNGTACTINLHDNVGLSSQWNNVTIDSSVIGNFSSGTPFCTNTSNATILPSGYGLTIKDSSINESITGTACMSLVNTSYVTITRNAINCKDSINATNGYTNGASMGSWIFDGIDVSEHLVGHNFLQIKAQAGYPVGFGIRGITFHDMIVSDISVPVSLIGADASSSYTDVTSTDSWVNSPVDCTGTAPSGLLLQGGLGSGDVSNYPSGGCWGTNWTYQSVTGLWTFGGTTGIAHTSLAVVGNLGINTETMFGTNVGTLAPLHVVGTDGRTSITSGSITSGTDAIIEDNGATLIEQLLSTNTSLQQILFGRVSNLSAGRVAYNHSTDTMLFGVSTDLLNLTSSSMYPSVSSGIVLGSSTFPFGNLYLGTSAAHNVNFNTSLLNNLDTIIIPDNSGTLAELNLTQNWSALQNFNSGVLQPLTTPASSSGSCTQGQVEWDASYVYVCTATNTWKRTALSSF